MYRTVSILLCAAVMTICGVTEVQSATKLSNFILFQGKKVSEVGTRYNWNLESCAGSTMFFLRRAFLHNSTHCQVLESIPAYSDMVDDTNWDIYIHKDSVPVPPTKMTACIAIALDVSESLTDKDHLAQEAALVNSSWRELTRKERLEEYDITATFIPFRHEVIESDVKSISSHQYPSADAFVAAEVAIVQGIMDDIQATTTSGLTDVSAVLQYVSDLGCEDDNRALLLVSDFIVTENSETLAAKLNQLKAAGFKIVAVGLDKDRTFHYFNQVGEASGLSVDMRGDYEDDLKLVLDKLFAV